ncbi:MAG: hypothetical protein ABR579_11755 [Actinomycetota bacterium]
MKRFFVRRGVLLGGLIALGLAVGILMSGDRGTTAATADPITGRSLSGGATDRASVIAHVRTMQTIRTLSRIEAKFTSWGEAAKLLQMDGRPADFTDTTAVWVVAVGGNVIGMMDPHGEQFSWAAYVIDSRNGLIRAEVANNDAPLPLGFTKIVDQGR